ncbi:MAG: hypothetical protein RSA98_07450 [Odoribacter sp.]
MKAIITVLCFLVLCLQLKAEESIKKYEKTFSKEGIEELVLSNSYGKIEISQGEGTEISVSVEMKVTAKSAVKADETLEFIQINEAQNGHYLNLETSIGKDMTISQLLSGMTLSVDYKVSIPKGIKLRLINNNGNIYLGNYAGELNVDMRNGDFKAATLEDGEFYIKQDKGNFAVEKVNTMDGDFKNCTIQIQSGEEIKIVANSCKGQFESIDKLNIRTSGGLMQLGEIEDLTGSSSMTKYEVKDIGNILDMDMKMGEMNVRNIQLMFSEIRLKSSFTKVGLTFMADAGYHLELKHNKSLKIDLPDKIQLDEQPTISKNVIVGKKFIGNVKYSGKVFLDMSSGSLFIQSNKSAGE